MTLNKILSMLVSDDSEIKDIAYNYIISNYDLNFLLYYGSFKYCLKPTDIKYNPKQELDIILDILKEGGCSKATAKKLLEQVIKLIIEYNNENRKR